MKINDFYKKHIVDTSLADAIKFNPYYYNMESGLTDPVIINGREYINLASNNYLGLACDKRVKKAIIHGVEKYGASMCGTPIATGYTDEFKNVEQKLSGFVGLEDTMIFPSCYQANFGIISLLAAKEDLIVVDHYAHNSLIQGIKSTGCKIKPFLHNDVNHLEKMLKRSSEYKQVFVITESVFSTEGSIAPFDEIVAVCNKKGAIPIIDDSHGIGVIGKAGKGILELKNIRDFQGIYTSSLGKALAIAGGMVSGKKELINYLRYLCGSYTYSTALPPALFLGIKKVIEIIESEFGSLSRTMWKYKGMISDSLKDSGYKTTKSEAPINSVICGSLEDTVKFSKLLFENNILSTPFIPPSVPLNSGKVRLIAGANLKEESIKKAIKVFNKVSGDTK